MPRDKGCIGVTRVARERKCRTLVSAASFLTSSWTHPLGGWVTEKMVLQLAMLASECPRTRLLFVLRLCAALHTLGGRAARRGGRPAGARRGGRLRVE